jgi:hypothetical protein
MNKKNIYKMIVIFFIIGQLMFTGCHLHTDRWHASEKNAARMTNYIAEKLELKEEQKAQLNKTITNLMAKKEEMLGDNALKDEIFIQLGNEKINEKRMNTIISQHTKEMEGLAKTFVANLTEFHSTQTFEQKKELAKLVAEHKDQGHKHHRAY